VLHGGGQERGRRSGTENVAFAVAAAAALEAAERERPDGEDRGLATVDRDRDAFIAAVLARVSGSRLTGHPEQRIPGHASFVIDGVNGETVLLELERRGVVASSGSACAAGRTEPSHVLTALGLPDDVAGTAVRFSWTHTARAELDRAVDALVEAVAAVRRSVPA
jgi:cysteine desulfurase